LSKSNEIYPNLTNFAAQKLLGSAAASPAPAALLIERKDKKSVNEMVAK